MQHEHSSAVTEPNRIKGLNFYLTSIDPIRQNPIAGDSSYHPPTQGQGEPHAILSQSSQVSTQGPTTTFNFKFSGQIF
jgi:hypothetical protein